jgi:hypothetical protein
MDIPKRVVIGTQVWKISERSRTQDYTLNDDSFGYTLNKENTIVIDSQIVKSRKQQTLIHELFHAIRYSFGNPATPKKTEDIDTWEHYFIGMYEEGMLLVLRNNPEVLSYLLEVE